ncbi:MAG: HAD-IB family hydrolase [Magnetococcales bacterium]|nr:HAD-IB family hydrolase [Magnetococcales bacterium]
MTPPPPLVLFDLDGTLTRRDTQPGFLLGFLARHPQRLGRCLGASRAALAFFLGRLPRGEMKERATAACLGGVGRPLLEAWGEQFAARTLQNGLRPRTLRALREHQRRGETTVLSSASLELYVRPIARLLGFDHCHATPCAWTADNALASHLGGPPLYGGEKLAALAPLWHEGEGAGRRLIVYTDHHGDIPLLEKAARAVLVHPTPALRRWARAASMEIDIWD